MKTTMKIRTMLAGAACLCAALSASATEWTYSASGTTYTITDGQWTLKVGKLAATDTTLKVTGISGWEDPTSTPDKKGVLDLRKPLTVTVNDATATISSVEVAQSALGWKTNIVEICCDIIGAMADSCFAGNANMTNIVIGGTAETLPGLVVNKCSKLKTATFGFPNLRKAGNAVGHGILGVNTTSLTPIDISTVAVPGITNVCSGAFANSLWRGDLVLTNVMTMGANAFMNAALTNVYVSGSLTNLANQVFRGTTITNVVFDLPNLESIAIDAFGHTTSTENQQKKIRSVEILSAISDMGQITNIVRYVSGTAASTGCRVYVSKRQWTKEARELATYSADENPTGYFADKATFTDAEKNKIAEDSTLAKAYGVLVVGGARKAFVVNKPSPHDKIQGLIIIIQ